MDNRENVRVDKFLWAVRLFKTRSMAAEACKKGRVQINGIAVKSSRTVKPGDTIDIKTPPVIRKYKVLKLAEKRMGAKLVPDHIKDITPDDQLEILELTRLAYNQGRRKGLGRPTKKDRRDLERLFNED
ncbi:MAG: RNA-binding S4 domain-containing protein [Chlorobi bacterium]|nr:RNA-binding S4 domain-containing protein [Chlorobiota bacterium]